MSNKSEIIKLENVVREKANTCGLVEISKLLLKSRGTVTEIYAEHLRKIMSDPKNLSRDSINLITNFDDLMAVEKAVKTISFCTDDEHITAFEEGQERLLPAGKIKLALEAEENARQCQTITEIELLYYNANFPFIHDVYEKRWIEIAKDKISKCKNWFDIDTLFDKDVKTLNLGKRNPLPKRKTISSVEELYRMCLRKFSHEKALADASKFQTLAQAIKRFKFAKKSSFYSEEARAIYAKKYQQLAKKVIPTILKRCDTSEKVMMVFRLYILDDCPTKIYDICRLKWLQLHVQENF